MSDLDLEIIDSVISSKKVILPSDFTPPRNPPREPDLPEPPLTDLIQESSPSAIAFFPPSAPMRSGVSLVAPLSPVPSSTPLIVSSPVPLFSEADFPPLITSG